MQHHPTSADSPQQAPPARDSGVTIVENLMAIVLTGLIAASLFSAMWTLVRSTGIAGDRARIETVLSEAVDALADADFIPCPGLEGYAPYAQQAAFTVGWEPSAVAVTRVRYWDPFSEMWSDTNPLDQNQCTGASFLSTARAMQLVEVTVTSPEQNVAETVETVVTDLREVGVGGG